MSDAATIACPYCAETILAAAKKCKHCGELIGPHGEGVQALPEKRKFKHGLHIFLSIITAGAWIPIWVLLYLFRDKYAYY